MSAIISNFLQHITYAFKFFKVNFTSPSTKLLEDTTFVSCTCNFLNSIKLPCFYILAKRKLNHSLFLDDHYATRDGPEIII